MSKKAFVARSIAVVSAAGILAGIGAGVAGAVVPNGAAVANPMSSNGIWFYNDSSDNLTLAGVSGDNEGVPAVGSQLAPGLGHQDFEVTFRAAKSTTVTAVYTVTDSSGTDLGTETVKFSTNAMDASNVTSSSQAAAGGSLPLQTSYINDSGNWELEDSTPTVHQLDATDPAATQIVQQYCNNANNTAICTFKPTGKPVATTNEQLLASGYNSAGSSEPSNLSLTSGYDDQTSTNAGGAVSVTMKLGEVFKLGIQQTYNTTIAFDTTFSATASIQVEPGKTGYIWGDVPVIRYTGIMDVSLGNTTWQINGDVLNTPDSTRPLDVFTTGTYQGEFPLPDPSLPPNSK